MAEGQEDLLQELIQAYRQTMQFLRSTLRLGQSLHAKYSRAQVKRTLVERGRDELRQNENLQRATQDLSPAERTQLFERHADTVLQQNDALEAQARDLRDRNQELLQQNAVGEQRLAEQQRLLDAERNADRNRDGLNDGDVNDVAQRDAVDDRVQDNAVDDAAQQQALDDANADRERAEAESAAAEQKQKEQDEANRRNQERGDGIDPAAAAETAAAAELATGELDNELDRNRADDLQQQEQPGLDENGERLDPASQADSELDTGTDDAERGQVDPAAAAAADEGLDAGDRQQQDDLGQGDPSQDQPGLGDQQPAADLDQSAGQDSPGATNEQDGSHLELNSNQEWDGTVHQVGEEGTRLTVRGDEQGQQSGPDVDGPDVDGLDHSRTESAEAVNVGSIEGQTFTVGDGTVQFADQNGPQNETASGQQDDLAQNPEVSGPGQDEPAQQPQQVDGQQVNGQVDAQQVDARQIEAPQAEAPQADAQQVQAPEQGANQVPQVKAPDTQQVASAAQNAVDETAGLGADEQGTGGQTSEAQGSQWRPPEQPAIDEARANQPNGQQSGPSRDLPPDEKAKLDGIRDDQKPLSSVKVDAAAVAAGGRPGTPAQQREQNLGRGGRDRGDDGGRGRGGS